MQETADGRVSTEDKNVYSGYTAKLQSSEKNDCRSVNTKHRAYIDMAVFTTPKIVRVSALYKM